MTSERQQARPQRETRPDDLTDNRGQRCRATAPARHLGQHELANRRGISGRTLERWRWVGQGPLFLKFGGRVAYRIADIEAFEAKHLRGNDRTSPPPWESSGPGSVNNQ